MKKTILFPLAISVAFLSLSACGSDEDGKGANSPYADSGINFQYGECSRVGFRVQNNTANSENQPEEENFAVITISDGKTNVHLSSVSRYCDSNLKVRASKTADTLDVEAYSEDGSYLMTGCSCASSMDVSLDYADYDILVIRYGGYGRSEYSYYPASYEE